MLRLPRMFVPLLLLASVARAQTHVISFGGGPTPMDDQVSLEKNVEYFRQTLADLHLANAPQQTFFADGGSPHHVVEYELPADPARDFLNTLGYLMQNTTDLDERYEPVSLPHLDGPSTPDALNACLAAAAKSLRPRDQLLFYFTGHGGADNGRFAAGRNTTMDMWDAPPVRMREFARQLDKFDPAVAVTLIMVQCHSGGFANVIYTDGDPKKGLSSHARCGFFSTVSTRLAAGCTPEMNDADYRDFSTYFFAALSGKTRTGHAINKPDYDRKGYTSLTDAFTYTLLNDDTIDLPMTTSDQLLRDFSRYRMRNEPADLLEGDARYADLLAAASPAQRAALEGLSGQLKLSGQSRILEARALARKAEDERQSIDKTEARMEKEFTTVRDDLHDAVAQVYPELAIPWHPQTPAILQHQLPEIQKYLESLPEWKKYRELAQRRNDLFDQEDALELKWVLAQRFLERARTVILAANLPKVAKPDVVRAYEKLVALENQPMK